MSLCSKQSYTLTLFFEKGKLNQVHLESESPPAPQSRFLIFPKHLGLKKKKPFLQDCLGGWVLPSSLPWWSGGAQECWPLGHMARPVCSLLLEWAAWEVLISWLLTGARRFLNLCIHFWDKLSNGHQEVSSQKEYNCVLYWHITL